MPLFKLHHHIELFEMLPSNDKKFNVLNIFSKLKLIFKSISAKKFLPIHKFDTKKIPEIHIYIYIFVVLARGVVN
jgi:hypothetical protein